ncbi:MAG TPA: tryptophan halogenase family protein [Sphingomonas sp.]|nr:tryptophan halogenase family protein [Sphingomonas sp.]
MPAQAPHSKRVVIAGGGAAGWMTALALATRLPAAWRVTLVESSDVAPIGVGEATLPTIRFFNRALGIDEREFVRRTGATFKLGIDFCDWSRPGERFIHGFGDYGPPIEGRPSHHQMVRLGLPVAAGAIDAWSAACVAAREERFAPPRPEEGSVLSRYSYGYHFDAALYAVYLRELAEARGVERLDRRIVGVELAENGDIAALRTAEGDPIAADLFVDCTGFRALLIGEALGAPFDDWSRWLPCDRAWAVPTVHPGRWPPVTRATAMAAGWRWRIPLRQRIGNGHVFASAFLDEQAALADLEAALEEPAAAEPRLIRFRTGRRQDAWRRNCVAIGLSAAFIEPLESTGLHLIESATGLLIELFPQDGCRPDLSAAFNRRMGEQLDRLRDFVILHYRLSAREEPFWRHMREIPIPDELAHRIELFRRSGQVVTDPGSFGEPSWLAILLGMGLVPDGYDPLADALPRDAVAQHFARGRELIARAVQTLPAHRDYLQAVTGEALAA